MRKVHIITPVKNALERTMETIAALYRSETEADWSYTLYNDRSDRPTTEALHCESVRRGFRMIDVADRCDTPSPNYRLILQWAREEALADDADLLILESDVVVAVDTVERIAKYAAEADSDTALVAAITVDDTGAVNYPYLYAKNVKSDGPFKRHLSFCCTLLTNRFLSTVDFATLDPKKNFFDVALSHRALSKGMRNHLLVSAPVIHHPNSSRPTKALKRQNPLKYYWLKLRGRLYR